MSQTDDDLNIQIETVSTGDTVEKDDNNKLNSMPNDKIEFWSGEKYNIANVDEIRKEKQTYLITVAGPVASGKTTLLSCIYEILQLGRAKSVSFVGSKTLIGFERLCHLSRVSSMSATADTDHTSMQAGETFLHLDLKYKSSLKSFLFSDISGELFSEISASESDCLNTCSIINADIFCIVFDSEKLTDIQLRQNTRTTGLSILRSCIDSKAFKKDVKVNIIFTKYDTVKKDDEGFKQFEKSIIRRSKELLAKQSIPIAVHKIAARPPIPSQNFRFGHGIENLVESWFLPVQKSTSDHAIFDASDTEFNKIFYRVINDDK